MKKCKETKKFILPQQISKIELNENELKVFSVEENEVNLRRCKKKKFYDAKICRHLCSKTLVLETTRTNSISPCESICYVLTRSFDSAGDVCPGEKYCQNGCPCLYYECEKLDASHQKLIPVFNLRKSVSENGKDASKTDDINDELITNRWTNRESHKNKIRNLYFALTDFTDFDAEVKLKVHPSFFPYERCSRFNLFYRKN